jgi:hypothetical protein
MAATSASLDFSITVTGVTGLSFDATTRQNVKKRIADILYLAEPPEDAVHLSYAGSSEITALNSLFIGDRSDRLYLNSKVQEGTEFIITGGGQTSVDHKLILTTQKFGIPDDTTAPLYFKHVLDAQIDLESVKIFDKNFQEVSSDHYLVELQQEYDEDTGQPVVPASYIETHVYNSLENSFNTFTGEYEAYYIQHMNASNVVTTTLLDNTPAYHEATIDDIWYVSNELAPWSKAYIVDTAGNNYYLTTPNTGEPTAVKYIARSRLQVLPPALIDDTSLWLPRVANGNFRWAYGHAVETNYSYAYEVPEFAYQSFNPYEPYKMTDRAQATKIAPNLLKLAHEEVQEPTAFFRSLSITIEQDGSAIYAFTEDAALVGQRYETVSGQNVLGLDGEYVVWSDTELLSVDHWSGIVQLGITLKDYWSFYGAYTYKETALEVVGLNMNPVFDREAHKQIRALYLVPQSAPNGNTGIQEAAIRWVKVSPAGIIEETNQDGTSNNPNIAFDAQRGDADAYSISGVVGLHYNWRASTYVNGNSTIDAGEALRVEHTADFPRSGWIRVKDSSDKWVYVKYTSKTDTTLVLSDDSLHVPDTPFSITYSVSDLRTVEVVNFIDQYTTLSISKNSIEYDAFGLAPTALPNCWSQYFVLAEMAINPPHGIDDIALIDVREDGGGVHPTLYNDAKQLNPEVQWYYDFLKYSGQPTPGNAAAVIKLPVDLLKTFTEEQVEAIIDDNISYGIKPLIRWYGYTPQITSVTPRSGGLLVKWEKLGTEFVYDVWYASNSNGPWSKHNATRLADGLYAENQYLVDGLDSEKTYFVKVTCLDKYDMWWCSYTSYNSVGGGLGRDDDAPTYPFGNTTAFKIEKVS